jgi:hypothetical protein
MHDPMGSTKDIALRSNPSQHQATLSYRQPAKNMSRPGNDFTLSGHAVWRLLRGDWYDAAQIYRRWVVAEAEWYPDLGKRGRTNTPQWMRQLPVWALRSGDPDQVAEQVKKFQQFMGVPVGFHWYNWHQIPFDNDYPHYFPTEPGMGKAVQQMQANDIYVMPYINGRLWDTHDQKATDWRFSKIARPAAVKKPTGEPRLESYGSKEETGEPVRLAPMCPSTNVWQNKVNEIVSRLFNEPKVNAVYLDQIGCAEAELCFDADHNHPLGGGDWWNRSYWQLLDRIRRKMPADAMLTTECNAEPFLRHFDGFLTWHWQYEGQVPAFPAVYGGAIQLFGRAYRGGPTRDRALRMRAAQQLVFGEQLGWIDPNIINRKQSARYLRKLVRIRWQLKRYFYAGRMGRPPELTQAVPTIEADWRWQGEWPVQTDTVMTGAWYQPQRKRAVILVLNAANEKITTGLNLDLHAYGFTGNTFNVTRIKPTQRRDAGTTQRRFQQKIELEPRGVRAWQMTPAGAD